MKRLKWSVMQLWYKSLMLRCVVSPHEGGIAHQICVSILVNQQADVKENNSLIMNLLMDRSINIRVSVTKL